MKDLNTYSSLRRTNPNIAFLPAITPTELSNEDTPKNLPEKIKTNIPNSCHLWFLPLLHTSGQYNLLVCVSNEYVYFGEESHATSMLQLLKTVQQKKETTDTSLEIIPCYFNDEHSISRVIENLCPETQENTKIISASLSVLEVIKEQARNGQLSNTSTELKAQAAQKQPLKRGQRVAMNTPGGQHPRSILDIARDWERKSAETPIKPAAVTPFMSKYYHRPLSVIDEESPVISAVAKHLTDLQVIFSPRTPKLQTPLRNVVNADDLPLVSVTPSEASTAFDSTSYDDTATDPTIDESAGFDGIEQCLKYCITQLNRITLMFIKVIGDNIKHIQDHSRPKNPQLAKFVDIFLPMLNITSRLDGIITSTAIAEDSDTTIEELQATFSTNIANLIDAAETSDQIRYFIKEHLVATVEISEKLDLTNNEIQTIVEDIKQNLTQYRNESEVLLRQISLFGETLQQSRDTSRIEIDYTSQYGSAATPAARQPTFSATPFSALRAHLPTRFQSVLNRRHRAAQDFSEALAAEAEDQAETLAAKIKALETAASEKEAQMAALKAQMELVTETQAQLEEKNRELEKKLQASTTETARLSAALAGKTAEHESMSADLATQTKEVQEKQEALTTLQAAFAEAEKNLAQAKDAISALQEQNKALPQLQKEIDDLKTALDAGIHTREELPSMSMANMSVTRHLSTTMHALQRISAATKSSRLAQIIASTPYAKMPVLFNSIDRELNFSLELAQQEQYETLQNKVDRHFEKIHSTEFQAFNRQQQSLESILETCALLTEVGIFFEAFAGLDVDRKLRKTQVGAALKTAQGVLALEKPFLTGPYADSLRAALETINRNLQTMEKELDTQTALATLQTQLQQVEITAENVIRNYETRKFHEFCLAEKKEPSLELSVLVEADETTRSISQTTSVATQDANETHTKLTEEQEAMSATETKATQLTHLKQAIETAKANAENLFTVAVSSTRDLLSATVQRMESYLLLCIQTANLQRIALARYFESRIKTEFGLFDTAQNKKPEAADIAHILLKNLDYDDSANLAPIAVFDIVNTSQLDELIQSINKTKRVLQKANHSDTKRILDLFEQINLLTVKFKNMGMFIQPNSMLGHGEDDTVSLRLDEEFKATITKSISSSKDNGIVSAVVEAATALESQFCEKFGFCCANPNMSVSSLERKKLAPATKEAIKKLSNKKDDPNFKRIFFNQLIEQLNLFIKGAPLLESICDSLEQTMTLTKSIGDAGFFSKPIGTNSAPSAAARTSRGLGINQTA